MTKLLRVLVLATAMTKAEGGDIVAGESDRNSPSPVCSFHLPPDEPE